MCNSDKQQAGAKIEVTPEMISAVEDRLCLLSDDPSTETLATAAAEAALEFLAGRKINDARVCPTNHVIHRCDPAHVMLCTGARNGY